MRSIPACIEFDKDIPGSLATFLRHGYAMMLGYAVRFRGISKFSLVRTGWVDSIPIMLMCVFMRATCSQDVEVKKRIVALEATNAKQSRVSLPSAKSSWILSLCKRDGIYETRNHVTMHALGHLILIGAQQVSVAMLRLREKSINE